MVLLAKSDSLDKANLSSLKRYAVGGSHIPYKLAARLNSYLPNGNIIPGYGMTELGGVISYQSTFSPSVGQLVSNATAKIVDEHGNRCGVGMDGEIRVKSATRFLGYYNNKKATDDFIDSEGFIKTGDIGRFDANGSLHIVERKSEFLKYRNHQISPAEIETFLMNIPNVNSVAVVGIDDSKCADGVLLAAVIVRYDDSHTTEHEILKIVSGK